MPTEIPLGPPRRTVRRVVGAVTGVPIGIGVVFQPHALLLGIGGGVFLTYVVGCTALAMRRMRRFATENNLALGALGRGELANAREVFARWARSNDDAVSALARHNLGWTLILEGRAGDAVTILEDAALYHQRALTHQSQLPTTRVDIALCHALLGDLDRADAWYAKADEPVKAPPRPTFKGMMAIVRGLIDCRRERAAEAMVSLEQAWAEHEATMSGETLRMMRVLRAFACAAADGPRNQGLVERVLGDMRPRYAGELAFLGGTWPEMATFLATHRLDG